MCGSDWPKLDQACILKASSADNPETSACGPSRTHPVQQLSFFQRTRRQDHRKPVWPVGGYPKPMFATQVTSTSESGCASHEQFSPKLLRCFRRRNCQATRLPKAWGDCEPDRPDPEQCPSRSLCVLKLVKSPHALQSLFPSPTCVS